MISRYNAWHLNYAGFASAALPGIGLASLGLWTMFLGLCVSVALGASLVSIRAALTELVWYRLFVGMVFAATLAFAVAGTVVPSLEGLFGVVWALAVVAIEILFFENFQAVHGQDIRQSRPAP